MENTQEKSNIVWYKWELLKVNNEKTGGTKKVTSCVQKVTTVQDYISDLQNDLERCPSPIFRVNWQHKR